MNFLELVQPTLSVIRGLFIEVSRQDHGQWFTFDSTVGPDRITVWLEIHCDKNLQIPSADSSADSIEEQIAEGEMLLL